MHVQDGFNLSAVGTGLPDSELDLNSDAFCALPLPAQLRVVQLAREQLDTQFYRKRAGQVDDADHHWSTENISQQQIGRLLLRRRLAERHEHLSAQLTREEAARQVARLNNPHLTATLTARMEQFRSDHQEGDPGQELCTTALRIQSQSTGHLILIKKSPLKPGLGQAGPTRTNLTLERAENAQLQYETSPIKSDGKCSADSSGEDYSSSQSGDPVSRNVESNNAISSPSPAPSRVLFQSESSSAGESEMQKSLEMPDLNEIPFVSELESPTVADSEASIMKATSVLQTQEKDEQPRDLSVSTDVQNTLNRSENEEKLELENTERTKEPLAISEISQVSETKVTQEVIAVNNDEEDDEDDADFVDVPIQDSIVADVNDDLNMKEKEAHQVVSSENSSSSEASDLELALLSQAEKDLSCTENWFEDEESFALDDDVLREEADRLARQAQTTTAKCVTEAQDLIRLFGMPFVVSPEEAEAQCVTLQRTDSVDLVASDDSDVWPFGARYVCRHLFGGADEPRSKPKHRSPSCYRIEDVRTSLGLDVANILRLAMLCGSDYTPGIRNVGPVTAVEILSEFVRQAPEPEAEDSEWTKWLRGMDAPDHLVHLVIEPLKQFVLVSDWWHNSGSNGRQIQPSGEVNLVKSPVRRKWINLRPPPGFPDPKIVEAYLRPKVNTDLHAFQWETPNVGLLVKYPFFLKRQQQRSLSAAPLTGPQLITHYFAKAATPTNSSSTEVPDGKCEVPDEVSQVS
ncbi:unnamed protein product [Echinostoma caproni]|uniref:XPGI domain-containing protein n=1 Tax=Echinostoma caproni TaxID=27848 RepID=A0A183AR09_9TREM|nr:unnamed protein product [Echinostoma caproni]